MVLLALLVKRHLVNDKSESINMVHVGLLRKRTFFLLCIHSVIATICQHKCKTVIMMIIVIFHSWHVCDVTQMFYKTHHALSVQFDKIYTIKKLMVTMVITTTITTTLIILPILLQIKIKITISPSQSTTTIITTTRTKMQSYFMHHSLMSIIIINNNNNISNSNSNIMNVKKHHIVFVLHKMLVAIKYKKIEAIETIYIITVSSTIN